MRNFLYCLIICLLFTSCNTNRFLSEKNYELTKTHQKVAILPVEVTTTGKLPDISAKDLERLEAAESFYFQDIILSSILRKQRRNRPYWVDFMSNNAVNSKLKDLGINHTTLKNYSEQELAELLEVDAVVSTKVNKERYMSDLASSILYGVDVTIQILTGNSTIPPILRRTHDVNFNISVVSKHSTVIYTRFIDLNIDFRKSIDDAVTQLSRKIGRKFPYREYNY